MIDFNFNEITIPEYDSVPPVYVITHERPEVCENNTLFSLREYGYTGKVVYIVDDEDNRLEDYKKLQGEVEVFSKKEMAAKKDFDTFLPHTGEIFKTVLYARRAVFDIAKKRGDKYFCTIDDDCKWFELKMRLKNKVFNNRYPKSLDVLINLSFDLLKSTNASVVAWSQNGDLMSSRIAYTNLRKAMNMCFYDVDRPYYFYGAVNEDTTAYVVQGRQGKLILTIPFILVKSFFTQKDSGGLTEFYRKFGTYVKSFFSIISTPSAVKICRMGEVEGTHRIHHSVDWEHCAPRILSPDWQQRMKEKGYTGTRARLNKKHVRTKVNKFIS